MYDTTFIKCIAPLLRRSADISFIVKTHRRTFIWQRKRQEIRKTLLEFASRVSSPQCHRRGSEEEACKPSPSLAVSPDPRELWCPAGTCELPSTHLPPRPGGAERVFFTTGAPSSSSLSPCQCGVMESDFRTVRRLIPFVPPTMGRETGRQRTCPDVCGEVWNKEAHNGFTAGFRARVLLI